MGESDGPRNPFGINETKRYVSEGAERELFRKYKVGESGVVELVDYMGGDGMVERVATAGHGRDIFPENPTQKEFFRYLASNGIIDPFKSTQFKFSIQSPIEVALAFVYESSANVNEYSLRYSEALETSHSDSVDRIARVLLNNGLSYGESTERSENLLPILEESRRESFEGYQDLIKLDMARELARSGLSISQDTRYFWKMDLVSLVGFHDKYRLAKANQSPEGILVDFLSQVRDISWESGYDSWNALVSPERSDGKDYLEVSGSVNLTMPRDNEVVDGPLSPAGWEERGTRRVIVPEVEEILFERRKVLDHGEFQVVDYMGTDTSMAQAARTSYGEGTKTLQDDQNLIRSLIRDVHSTPTEMTELAFESKAPVFSDPRQAGRHRTLPFHGFMGGIPVGDQFYFPADPEFKYQDRTNRQGRGKEMNEEDLPMAKSSLKSILDTQLTTSKELRDQGYPEEFVRRIKGVGFYTKTWRTGDANNLSRFLGLRLDSHAQKEIRVYAEEIDRAMKAHTPIANKAFHDYNLDGMRLSRMEVEQLETIHELQREKVEEIREESNDYHDPVVRTAIRRHLDAVMDVLNLDTEDLAIYKGQGWVIPVDREDPEKGKKLGREGEAFKGKLERLMVPPTSS